MRAITIGALIWITYTLVAINLCAIARAHYLATIGSSVAFMVANFFLIQHVSTARTMPEFASYVVCGVAGDLTGIYISKRAGLIPGTGAK